MPRELGRPDDEVAEAALERPVRDVLRARCRTATGWTPPIGSTICSVICAAAGLPPLVTVTRVVPVRADLRRVARRGEEHGHGCHGREAHGTDRSSRSGRSALVGERAAERAEVAGARLVDAHRDADQRGAARAASSRRRRPTTSSSASPWRPSTSGCRGAGAAAGRSCPANDFEATTRVVKRLPVITRSETAGRTPTVDRSCSCRRGRSPRRSSGSSAAPGRSRCRRRR